MSETIVAQDCHLLAMIAYRDISFCAVSLILAPLLYTLTHTKNGGGNHRLPSGSDLCSRWFNGPSGNTDSYGFLAIWRRMNALSPVYVAVVHGLVLCQAASCQYSCIGHGFVVHQTTLTAVTLVLVGDRMGTVLYGVYMIRGCNAPVRRSYHSVK
jgi:hypothetical protein